MVKRGENIPEEPINYVTIRNKRNRQTIANNLVTNIPIKPRNKISPKIVV